MLEELHYCLLSDALGVETAGQKASKLMTPAQTVDLVIRKRQGLLEDDPNFPRTTPQALKGQVRPS